MSFYDKYGLIVLFVMALGCLVCLFIYNVVSGASGTFVDHTNLIKMMFAIPTAPQSISPKVEKIKPKESLGEAECRRVAEKLTRYPFPKQRPAFLRNAITNSNLELDCYCDKLKIAIEYNGRQHYEYTPYFHSSRDAFYTIKYRDEMKARLCRENNVTLIVVPYTVPVNRIEPYIQTEFLKLGLL